MKNRFSLLYLLFAVLVAISTITRVVLTVKAWPHLDASFGLLLRIFGTGFFFDCVAFLYFAIPFVLYLVLVPDRLFLHPWHRPAIRTVFFCVIGALVFNAAAEYLFFDEFGTRYNFIAVDYLVYTREVVGNIRESYPLVPILGAVFAAAAVIYLAIRKLINRSLISAGGVMQRILVGAFFAAVPVLSFILVSQSLTAISANHYANEIAGNGLYDLAAAFRNSELDYARFYATRDEEAVLALLREQMRETNNHFTSRDPHDITRVITNPGPEKKLNVIVVIEESLSAEFLGTFGFRGGYTPNLDRLANESLLFTHAYATGTRTVRGLEAITLSMPPLPGVSLVKRPGNENFFSWGTLMKGKGYDTRYIYAGHGYFDNMNYFFSHNGFSIVDRSAFEKNEVTFANIWGVCDEDLFRKTVQEGDRSFAAGKPFFSMVMTTSNHRPYTYPDGKIDVPSGTGRGGGVKYADYAIGRLIREARTRPWFRDTLFVIVADHCAASAGRTDLPVKRYEIPLLVYAPAHVKPRRVGTMMSQVDIAPTVLGLLNFSYTSKFMGRDVLKMDPSRERAFISTYQLLGYLQKDSLVVLGPQQYLKTYSLDRETGAVREDDRAEATRAAVAYFQGANYVYTNRLNRIKP